MKTTLRTDWTVADVCKGFNYDLNEDKGMYGIDGKLIIQPSYQRNYVYGKGGKDVAVVDSLVKGYPLGLMYFVKTPDGKYEVLDGQQRITSFARFVSNSNPFAVMIDGNPYYVNTLPPEIRRKVLDTKLTVYVYEGTENEILQWFSIINIAGMALTDQELRNAAYNGPFVDLARKTFSNVNNQAMSRWKTYVNGDPRRQEILEKAIKWADPDGDVGRYMSVHRNDKGISDLTTRFDAIINWASSTFDYTGREMRSQDWRRLYDERHNTAYSHDDLNSKVSQLLADQAVTDKKGIFEYVLSGCSPDKAKLLNIRLFDDATKVSAYNRQTLEAKAENKSNCPMCALTDGPNKTKIWELKDMDADHVDAWSKGGATDSSNCQMLCKPHNRSKGNR